MKERRKVTFVALVVIDYLPSPIDVPGISVAAAEGEEDGEHSDRRRIKADPDAPFAGLAFKIINDKYGTLTFVRVYAGTLKSGDTVMNTTREHRERMGRMFQMHADKRAEIKEVACRRHRRVRRSERHRHGRARAGAFQDIAGIGKIVLDGSREIGMARAWTGDGFFLGPPLPRENFGPVLPVFVFNDYRDGRPDGLGMPDTAHDVRAVGFDLHPAAAAEPFWRRHNSRSIAASDTGIPAGIPVTVATRHSPWDSPAVSNLNM